VPSWSGLTFAPCRPHLRLGRVRRENDVAPQGHLASREAGRDAAAPDAERLAAVPHACLGTSHRKFHTTWGWPRGAAGRCRRPRGSRLRLAPCGVLRLRPARTTLRRVYHLLKLRQASYFEREIGLPEDPERLYEKFRPPRAAATSGASWRGKSSPHCSWASVHSLCSSGATGCATPVSVRCVNYKTVIQTFFVLVVLHDASPLRIFGFG
jgi:hypothetical protein